ncbi:MAG: hypothetical protein GW911_17480 [Armatimonadetes bacterium]|nr:hypothetical protein [Armatimonadota bacterium]NCO92217.1 hypothetical protein [Armatimonadota bacterium]NCP32648.1 hypothetical protein [Armatimonadota bacterium]NCQ31028.1 hypothetical protein [Armatimonadota bacterium]NDK13821.1 hypothetical protein [Armatimonadota bacterium]
MQTRRSLDPDVSAWRQSHCLRERRGHLAVAALCWVLAGASWGQNAPLFQDPFVDLHNWNAPDEWRVENGALVVAGGDIRTCNVGKEWTNYAVELDVVIRKLRAQWVIRADSERDCCFIQLTSKDCPYSPNSLRYHGWRDGKLDSISEDALPFDIELGQTYHVRCEVVNHAAQTLIDGKVRGSWMFDDGATARWPRGTLGFRSSAQEAAVYRNLKVVACEAFTPYGQRKQSLPKAAPSDPFLNPPFRAEWIWSPGEKLDRYFRREFNLDADALEAQLWITADNGFTLLVNGKEVGKGKDWYSPQTFDLKPYLRTGRNVLAVAGHNDAPGSAGVLAEGNVLLVNGKHVPLVSTADWRISDVSPAGWAEPGFDDSAWAKATSLGRHPLAPWAGQAQWRLPYLGPLEVAEAESLEIASPLQRGQPVKVRAQFRLPRAFSAAHPVRLSLRQADGPELPVAAWYPQPPTTTWKPGASVLTASASLDSRVFLSAGTYAARLELVGVHLTKGADRLHQEVAVTVPPRREPLPLSKRRMKPGLFTDQFGGAHRYRVDNGWLVYDGERMLPLEHGDGAYWCEDNPQHRDALEACRGQAALDRVSRFGLTEEPVRLRLLDSVVCAEAKSEADHEFSEDDGYGGKSRLLKIGGRTYRVTDNRRKLSYFAYTMRCLTPGKPHLLVFETPNDRERYTLVRIQPPWHNVGCGPYTGRDLPCDGKPYQAGFVFYPEEEDIRLTVSRLPCELQIDPESGGAVSRLWLFEVAPPPSGRPDSSGAVPNKLGRPEGIAGIPAETVPTPGPNRRIGLSQTHPGYLYDLYGHRSGDLTQRLASLTAFADYADFVGLNYLEYNAINGADTSETAYYPSEIWNPYRGGADLFREFLPIAEERGFGVVPCLTSLALDIDRFTNAPWISPLTFQIDKDGFRRRDFFANRGNDNTLPDPLRPEVQQVFLDTLREFGERCKDSPAVQGLAFRLNGKIGTCYVGYNEDERGATAGYSPWDLAEFQRDTGGRLPDWDDTLTDRWAAAWKKGAKDDPAILYIPKTYEWIHATCWDKWLDWRCGRLTNLVLRARDLTRSFRKDWNLIANCDMPSETPDRNILWPAGASALDLCREHGFDPRHFSNEEGVLLQQGYFLGGGEYFHHAGGGSYYQNPEAWGAFDYQPGLAELYRTPAGTSVELYHNYWEEFGVGKLGEFGTNFWGAGMMYPRGRYFFRPLVHALRTNNVHTLALFSWERGSEGHEGELRRFCRAFRSLPAVAAAGFEGQVEVAAGPPADETLWVRRFGERIGIVNENGQPRTVRLTLGAVKPGQAVYEYATQRKLSSAGQAGVPVVTVEIDAFDLRVLGAD